MLAGLPSAASASARLTAVVDLPTPPLPLATAMMVRPDRSAVTAARVTAEVRGGAVFVPYFVRQVQQQIRGSTENGVQLIPIRVEKEAA